MSDERDRDSIEADLAALLRDSVTGDVGWKSTDTCRHGPEPADFNHGEDPTSFF